MASISITSVKLDSSVKDRLQRLAESRDRKPHWLMKEAIEQYLEREEKRQTFRNEAIASWEEYQTSGEHVTSDAVTKWLDTWGNDDETPAPECHK
ncbi:CopG family ribbon-helix-helix protein [Phyllobacterium sp. SB3]|uniref:CopG family ribbon-helix-helix protein n=1 Tax=Phyllobacterium sp. SB3 TaxID=3156073 RepID=UPI0032AFBB52